MKASKTLLIVIIVLAILCVCDTTLYIIFAASGVLTNHINIDFIFAISTPVLYIVLSLLLSNYFTLKNIIKKMREENVYYLGEASYFYNYYMFSRRLKRLYRVNKKMDDAYIIALTSMKLSVMRNFSRNDVITDYIGRFAKVLVNKLQTNNAKIARKTSFCYYHGIFLIYYYGDIDEINALLKELEESMYNIAANNKLNVYVQPYFGVAKSCREYSKLLVDVEKASTARADAEKLYKTIEYYNPNTAKNTDINTIKELEDALHNEEFIVYYQPKFDLRSNTFISSEALIRWNSKTKGLIPPAKFIEIAENGGLIHQVDMYVFRKVCKDIRDAKKRGRKYLPVSVNFSMQEFYDNGFVDSLVEICKEFQLPPHYLYIEITESTSQVNTFMTVAIVNRLKEKGFKVLMDDFGTGYSNIHNLMTIPFDAVKIDRSYIKLIDGDPKAYEFVKLLINLCKTNNILVVAEGVDNEEVVNLLRKAKCDIIQGYYYSKPLPKEEYDKFIAPNGNSFEKGNKKKGEEDK